MTAVLIVIAVALAAGFVAALGVGLRPGPEREPERRADPEWPYFDQDSWRMVEERKRAMETEEARPVKPRPAPAQARDDRPRGRSR